MLSTSKMIAALLLVTIGLGDLTIRADDTCSMLNSMNKVNDVEDTTDYDNLDDELYSRFRMDFEVDAGPTTLWYKITMTNGDGHVIGQTLSPAIIMNSAGSITISASCTSAGALDDCAVFVKLEVKMTRGGVDVFNDSESAYFYYTGS